jgi:perosamine synthetase
MSIRYPVYEPTLGKLEEDYALDAIKSTWISSRGKYVDQFEQALASYISNGAKTNGRAIAVANGTLALHLAMLSLGIQRDDEVIVPSFTYIATSNCVEYVGARPVFADCEGSDWSISIDSVKKLITPNTKAVIAVHLYGVPADLTALRELCDQRNIFLVEDCAESLGSKINGIHCGRIGHISTYSFFGNKTITTGEGGALYTEIDSIYDRAIRLKSQGLAKHREYWHDIVGYNFRMTNVAAAIGCAQLKRIDEILEKKRTIDAKYRDMLFGLGADFQLIRNNVLTSAWMTTLLLESESLRDHVRQLLYQQGIETRPTFYPVHTMPMYSRTYSYLPTTESIALRGINLPSSPKLTTDDILTIVSAVRASLQS